MIFPNLFTKQKMNMGADLVEIARDLGARTAQWETYQIREYALQEQTVLLILDDYSLLDTNAPVSSFWRSKYALVGFISGNEYVFLTKVGKFFPYHFVETKNLDNFKKSIYQYIADVKRMKVEAKIEKAKEDFL